MEIGDRMADPRRQLINYIKHQLYMQLNNSLILSHSHSAFAFQMQQTVTIRKVGISKQAVRASSPTLISASSPFASLSFASFLHSASVFHFVPFITLFSLTLRLRFPLRLGSPWLFVGKPPRFESLPSIKMISIHEHNKHN